MLASRVDRSAINEMLLDKTDRFTTTPKYAAVTQRLYQPYKDLSSQLRGASTLADTDRLGTTDMDDMVNR